MGRRQHASRQSGRAMGPERPAPVARRSIGLAFPITLSEHRGIASYLQTLRTESVELPLFCISRFDFDVATPRIGQYSKEARALMHQLPIQPLDRVQGQIQSHAQIFAGRKGCSRIEF